MFTKGIKVFSIALLGFFITITTANTAAARSYSSAKKKYASARSLMRVVKKYANSSTQNYRYYRSGIKALNMARYYYNKKRRYRTSYRYSRTAIRYFKKMRRRYTRRQPRRRYVSRKTKAYEMMMKADKLRIRKMRARNNRKNKYNYKQGLWAQRRARGYYRRRTYRAAYAAAKNAYIFFSRIR